MEQYSIIGLGEMVLNSTGVLSMDVGAIMRLKKPQESLLYH